MSATSFINNKVPRSCTSNDKRLTRRRDDFVSTTLARIMKTRRERESFGLVGCSCIGIPMQVICKSRVSLLFALRPTTDRLFEATLLFRLTGVQRPKRAECG